MSETKKSLSEKLAKRTEFQLYWEDGEGHVMDALAAEARALEERVATFERVAAEREDVMTSLYARAESAEQRLESAAGVIRELKVGYENACRDTEGRIVKAETRARALEFEVARLQEQWEWEAGCRAKVLTENDALRAKLEKIEAYVAERMREGWNYTDDGHAISLILDGEGSDEA